MKTRTTKTNKSEQLINSVPIISFILLAVIMTLYSNFSESNDSITEKQNISFMIPMKGFCFVNQGNQNLETDKLIERNKDITNLNLLAEKLSEYLIPEKEPESEFVMLPFTEKPVSEKIYIKNEFLENLREIKVAELEKFYAIQQICREYLVEETEPPLELEEWMCDENCWCFKNRKSLAIND